ncbi:DUF4062 domain-containing protein [Aeromonas dhakensis]
MDKRYQVFVSSTFTDLKDERSAVIQTLMKMDCIPAGMELFPAMDEEQFEFIKKVIDDCDYYLLILGARYGSISEEDGLSYTEKEYHYAKEKGMKIIALIHEEPEQLPVYKTDKNPILSEKLAVFRNEVCTGRMVQFWKTAAELPGFVALSLLQTIKTYPAIGWVRGDTATSKETLTELLSVKQENDLLKNEIEQLSAKPEYVPTNAAGLGHVFTVTGKHFPYIGSTPAHFSKNISFGDIFKIISPHITIPLPEQAIKNKLESSLVSSGKLRLDDECFQIIKVQFEVLGLVELTIKIDSLFWKLTPLGRRTSIEYLVVRAE